MTESWLVLKPRSCKESVPSQRRTTPIGVTTRMKTTEKSALDTTVPTAFYSASQTTATGAKAPGTAIVSTSSATAVRTSPSPP